MSVHRSPEPFDLDDVLPASPPPSVLGAIAAAGQRAAALAEADRELHFALDDDGGLAEIEVRDLSGGLIRRLTPSQALSIMGGFEQI
jgi:hypothetical protein